MVPAVELRGGVPVCRAGPGREHGWAMLIPNPTPDPNEPMLIPNPNRTPGEPMLIPNPGREHGWARRGAANSNPNPNPNLTLAARLLRVAVSVSPALIGAAGLVAHDGKPAVVPGG